MRTVLTGVGLILAVLLVMAFVPLPATETSISFTRYLFTGENDSSKSEWEFSATYGAALLNLQNTCTDNGENADNGAAITIKLNDQKFARADQPQSITLQTNNTLQLPTAPEIRQCLLVRVTQTEDVKMHVLSRVHFNTNVSSFTQARKFYGSLGFETLSGFPDTNTQAMARAIGIKTPTTYDGSRGDFAGGYLLHGELVGPKGFGGGVIDLIEFTVPRNESPPYAQQNHLGMTRGVMHTSNLDADVAYFRSQNIKLGEGPATRADGSRFILFSDLDGTQYELREDPKQSGNDSRNRPNDKTYISSLGAVAINVSDYTRSSAWYQMLGYEESRKLPITESAEVARAMGFNEPWEIVGGEVTQTQDGSTLELVEWRSPRDLSPPYPLPVNHLGMHRMAFSTSDIKADVVTLREQGVRFVSPITPCCSGDDSWGAIIAFIDPDGTVLELVEQPVMTPLLTLSMRLQSLSQLFETQP